MAESAIQLPADGSGKKLRTYDKGAPGHDQYVIPTTERNVTFRGSAATFRTPGRAGTAGQKLFAIHNATGSTVLVSVKSIDIDAVATVVKAVTVLPPVVRLHRFTVLPTNGTAAPKVAEDTALTSNASVVCLGDASADGTSTASGLTVTIPASNIVTQQFAPRLITAAGYEMQDEMKFLLDGEVVLRALQGLAVELVYTLATQNPITDQWTVTARFEEYTLP